MSLVNVVRTLYLCYFGLREPLVQTQVLPYLRQLSLAGIKVHLLTFEPGLSEKWSADELNKQRQQLQREGISWFCLPYHKRPSIPATVFDIFSGARFALRLMRKEQVNVLHARAHVPMAMALLARGVGRFQLIFDIRGLMAEEYADAGIWQEHSLPFRLVKKLEDAGIQQADQIVVLTERMRAWLISQRLKRAEQIQVIPCCVDFQRFATTQSTSANSSRYEVVYAGSLIGLYLVEEMGRFFKAIKSLQPDAFLKILSVSAPEQGAGALRRAGLKETDFEIVAVSPEEVPLHLHQARLGVSFRKSTFAQIAASPTKIPEYLAAGLPVVCNSGVGDMDELVEQEQVGVVLRTFDDDANQAAAVKALALAADESVHARAQDVARRHFDLITVGGRRYVDVYRRLIEQSQ
jgi:glycosyltransferase involved in cell wall biosynthesis